MKEPMDELKEKLAAFRAIKEENDAYELVFKTIFGGAYILACMVFSPIICGWVVQKLWGWFVLPQFHLPTPRLAMCIGLVLLVDLLVFKPGDIEDSKKEAARRKGNYGTWLTGIWISLFFLFTGWLVHLFL
jgi:hypothetical protein